MSPDNGRLRRARFFAGSDPAPAFRSIGHEMKKNEPSIIAKTRRKKGKKAANKQRIAILLAKARKAGVRVPKE